MSKRKQVTKPPSEKAKWYRWFNAIYPNHGLASNSYIAGIREINDQIKPNEVLPRDWMTHKGFRMVWNSGGLHEVTPEGVELRDLLIKFPGMKKYYSADELKALDEQIEKERLAREEESNG